MFFSVLHLAFRRLVRVVRVPVLVIGTTDQRIRTLEARLADAEVAIGELQTKVLVLEKEVQILHRRHPRPKLTVWDRFLLVVLSEELPRGDWGCFFVVPGTIIRWHREMVARKWTFRRKKATGRPPVDPKVAALIRRFARENPNWGYTRIKGECQKLGICVSKTTIKEVLRAAGIPPAPRRDGPTWSEFMRSYAAWIVAMDFFTVETAFLRTLYVLFWVEVGSRRLKIVGVTAHPTGEWVAQQARNLAMGGEFANVRFLIRDRDSKYAGVFDEVARTEGVKVVLTPVQAPKANAYAERTVGTIRRDLLDRVIVVNHKHLIYLLDRFEEHYNRARPHQGLDLHTPEGTNEREISSVVPEVCRVDVLGGLIHEYEAVAA